VTHYNALQGLSVFSAALAPAPSFRWRQREISALLAHVMICESEAGRIERTKSEKLQKKVSIFA